MECKLRHIHYAGKAQTTLNLRLITTEKTKKKPEVILACKQFEKQVHTLCKIPSFHLISWCRNFVERHSFRIVLGNLPETLRKLCIYAKFPHQKIRWNYGILNKDSFSIHASAYKFFITDKLVNLHGSKKALREMLASGFRS